MAARRAPTPWPSLGLAFALSSPSKRRRSQPDLSKIARKHSCMFVHMRMSCASRPATSRLGSDASGHARPNAQANRSWDPMSDQIIKHWCRLHRGFAVFRPDGLGQSWHYRGRGPSFHTRVARCLHACGCCQVHSSRTIAASTRPSTGWTTRQSRAARRGARRLLVRR